MKTCMVRNVFRSRLRSFVIFYNGSQEQPDRKILRLSDAYCVKEENPALELTAVMLNINRGHNEKLKEMCKSLKDYSEYTRKSAGV